MCVLCSGTCQGMSNCPTRICDIRRFVKYPVHKSLYVRLSGADAQLKYYDLIRLYITDITVRCRRLKLTL